MVQVKMGPDNKTQRECSTCNRSLQDKNVNDNSKRFHIYLISSNLEIGGRITL